MAGVAFNHVKAEIYGIGLSMSDRHARDGGCEMPGVVASSVPLGEKLCNAASDSDVAMMHHHTHASCNREMCTHEHTHCHAHLQ